MFPAVRRVVVEAGAGRLARALVLIDHQVDHGERGVRRQSLALGLEVAGGLVADVGHQAQRDFVGNRQRPHRHTGLARLVVDHRGAHAFAEHGDAFVGEGAEYPRGEEAAAVVDHDRRFLDLQHVVETACQGFVAGLFAADDLHQRHLVHRAEEVQADELLRPRHRLGQPGDRQGRGIGRHHRIGQGMLLGLGGDLAFQRAVLEDRLDDQVAAFEIGFADARHDPREEGVALLGGQVPARNFLVQQPGRIGLALLRRFQRDVLEHHLDAGRRRYVGDARAHHPGAEHADLFRRPHRIPLRPRLAGVDLVELEPEGADHVLRHLAGGQLGEIARLDQLRGVEIDLGALHRRAHDLLGRREATLGLVAQHRRCDGQHLRHVGTGRRTAGNLVAGAVPGLLRRRVGEDPGAGLLQHFLGAVGQFVDQPGLERFRRTHLLAFGEVRQGFLQTKQAHHTYHPAAARQQAESHLRQAELHAGIVQGDAVVAGQADLPAAAQRSAVDRGDHRLAEGLQAPQLALEFEDALVEGRGVGLGDLDQLVEIAAGEEGLLRRGQHHAGDPLFLRLQPRDGLRHRLAVDTVHGVGALPGHVHGQDDDVVLAFFVTDSVSHSGSPFTRAR